MRYLAFASVLLCAGLSYAQSISADPRELLGRAVRQSRVCEPVEKHRHRLDLAHKEIAELKIEKSEENQAKKLSLQVMFRDGRYRLGKISEEELSGKKVYRISFSPRPESEHIGILKGESRKYNWAMNRLSGEILIDPDSYHILSVEAETKREESFLKLFRLLELKVSIEQEDGAPREVALEIHYRGNNPKKFFILEEAHDLYTTRFNCGTQVVTK